MYCHLPNNGKAIVVRHAPQVNHGGGVAARVHVCRVLIRAGHPNGLTGLVAFLSCLSLLVLLAIHCMETGHGCVAM